MTGYLTVVVMGHDEQDALFEHDKLVVTSLSYSCNSLL